LEGNKKGCRQGEVRGEKGRSIRFKREVRIEGLGATKLDGRKSSIGSRIISIIKCTPHSGVQKNIYQGIPMAIIWIMNRIRVG